MPSPSTSLADLRPDLGGSVMEFDLQANTARAIGTQVFPVMEVGKKSGPFGRIPLAELLQTRETQRAPGGGYSRGSWKFEPDSYACVEHGAEEPVDDAEAEIYRDYFNAELISAERARSAVLLNHEKRVKELVLDTGTFNTTAVSTKWNDTENASPIADVENAVQRLYAQGVIANALVIGWLPFRNLRNCGEITERISASGAGEKIMANSITAMKLAEVFDLDHVLVGAMQENTADQGQTAVIQSVWGETHVAVCRVATTGDIREPCVGRTMHWAADGSSIGTTMESYREEKIRGDVIRSRFETDEKRIYDVAAELLSGVTA
ncbi:MAG: hypothetical protein COA96_17095 [SAR86 cluster bacterium]|uniref:Uncharacterized protein n=1 Tax=SAR86 cluster bacterium TaxID=2030880 RepID=A0A2A5AGG2_9GAMM|nr:MAG: hypothetical protein COA96_17095 [SAR86 cluster bacterium]